MESESEEVGKCRICHGKTNGYRCNICEVELPQPTPDHTCGEEHRMAVCARCGETEAKCDCEPND